jgi:glutathione S-transferase
MESNPIVVHGGWEAAGVPDFSPFCLKVKTYLRMTGVPYTSKLGDPRKAPTKKIPFIDDGGTRIGDSGLILDYLKKKNRDSLDARLTAEQHAIGHIVRRALEESLYFAVLYTRWVEDDAWPEIKKMLAPLMPPIIGSFLINGPIRGATRKAAFGQGIGRHSREQVHAIGCADVDAVAALLGDKPYLMGDAPSSYDAIFFGFMANTLAFPPGSSISLRAKSHVNLVSFVDRMKAKYWATPDARVPNKVKRAAEASPTARA